MWGTKIASLSFKCVVMVESLLHERPHFTLLLDIAPTFILHLKYSNAALGLQNIFFLWCEVESCLLITLLTSFAHEMCCSKGIAIQGYKVHDIPKIPKIYCLTKLFVTSFNLIEFCRSFQSFLIQYSRVMVIWGVLLG